MVQQTFTTHGVAKHHSLLKAVVAAALLLVSAYSRKTRYWSTDVISALSLDYVGSCLLLEGKGRNNEIGYQL